MNSATSTPPGKPGAGSDLGQRLLDAHVAHELSLVHGERFELLVREEVAEFLATAGQLSLDQVIDRSQVSAVAIKYVATFRLPGAIPEIAARIGAGVRAHPVNDIPLGEVIGRARVDELVAALTEMRALRLRILRGLADSSALQAGVGDVVHGMATGALASGRRLLGRVPLVSQGVDLAGAVAAPMMSPLTAAVDQRSRELAEHGAKVLLGYLGDNAAEGVSDDELRAAVLEVWDALATRPIGDLFGAVGEEELINLLLASYDLWSDVRTSEWISTAVESGVGIFFDTYGSFTLEALLEEFGLGTDDLIEEALRFAPPALETLRETGLLEAGVRRHLARFYESPEARALL